MSFMLDDLAFIYPDQLLLEFTRTERDRAWEKTVGFKYQDATSRWRAFLNALCSDVVTNYLKSDSNFCNTTLAVYPHTKEFPHLWQLINGIVITLNQTRLIIIPNEETDAEELRVYQEWVDLPEWVGHYYLAAHIDLDNCFLRISGFVTHRELLTQGHYDSFDKTYSFEITALTEDLSAMWVAWELSAHTQPQVASLPKLSSTEANHLIKASPYEKASTLRLAIPFQQWGSLLVNPKWRHLLYQYQQLNDLRATIPKQLTITNTTQWFKRNFEAGWYSIEALIANQLLQPSYSLRQSYSPESNDFAEGIKILNLGLESDNQVALIIKVFPKQKTKATVRIQLQSVNSKNYLPTNIKLSLLSQSNQILQQVQAEEQDRLIQIQKFTCEQGIVIQIQITLDNLTVTEFLKIETL